MMSKIHSVLIIFITVNIGQMPSLVDGTCRGAAVVGAPVAGGSKAESLSLIGAFDHKFTAFWGNKRKNT